MIRYYLREEPILRSVPSLDLGDQSDRKLAMEKLDHLVLKPRAGLGGEGVTILSRVPREERRRAVEEARRRPADFIAQLTVPLSTHPTVSDSRLEPRRVDLRPFVVVGERVAEAMPGGLTRFARERGEMVVNSSQGGGAKDTWVLA
jgi:carboxylate-amine ligase